jgi:Golgi phosphoprotein 3 (GPP34)
METLGEDLLLLFARSKDGRIDRSERIGFGLMGAELVRLAAAGRISIVKGKILVTDATVTGDPALDESLRSIAGAHRPPKANDWVARPRPGIRAAYLERLRASGAARATERTAAFIFPVTRWEVADASQLAGVRARLDAIAQASGPVDAEEEAYGGLAFAVGLHLRLYPGSAGRPARKRLAQIAKGQWSAQAVRQAGRPERGTEADGESPAQPASEAILDGPGRAAQQAGSHAAAHAASQAAAHAAWQAAAHAATQAAVHAATHAAISAAHHAGQAAASGHGHAGGGHGH